MKTSYQSELFNKFFDKIEVSVAFDPIWANGTGYFDHAVKADLGLGTAQMAKAVDPDGRRIIFIDTRLGNVVLFERRSPADEGTRSSTIVGNYPPAIRAFYAGDFGIGGPLSLEGLEHLLGDIQRIGKSNPLNIGDRLEGLFD